MQQEDGTDIKALLAMLRRQYRLIAMACLFALGLAGLYLFQATPLYRATALVFVDPSTKDLLDTADPQSLSGVAENARIESEVTILKSDKVLLTTLERAGLIADPEFGPRLGLSDKIRLALGLADTAPKDPADLTYTTLKRLRDAVSVRRSGLTYLLNVGVSSESGEKSARIANTLARTYIGVQLAAKRQGALNSSAVLQSQLETARSALSQSEQHLDRYIQANIGQIARETGNSELLTVSSRIKSLETDRLSREVRQRDADAALSGRDWTTLADSLGSKAIATLETERKEVEKRLSAAPPEAGTTTDLRQHLSEIDAQLEELGNSAVKSLRDEVSALTTTGNTLRQDLRSRILGADLAPATLTAIYELQQESDIAQRQYTALLSRMRDLETQAALQVADSRIVSEALPARSPYAPNTKLVLILALLFGLGSGLGIALLNEFYLGGVISASQLANLVPAPVLTTIPRIEQQPDQLSVADNIIDAPFSAFAESFRKLRAGLDRLAGNSTGPRVILVSSAAPGEGKTSVALALARTYALAGKQTLLIDGDLRKPSLHGHLGATAQRSFLDYLSDDTADLDDEDFYIIDAKSQTAVIIGRGRPRVPTDQVIQSRAFEDLLAKAREVLDIIIIDSSPVIPVVDARYMAPHADAVVMVVRYANSTQSDTRETYDRLRESVRPDTPIVCVFNIDEGTTQKYRYSSYYADYTDA